MNSWKRFGFAAMLTACVGITGACAVSAFSGNSSGNVIFEETKTIKNGDDVIDALNDLNLSDDKTYTIPEIVKETMPAMVGITTTTVEKVQNYFGGDPFDFFEDFYGFDDFGFDDRGDSGRYSTRETIGSGTGVIIKDEDDSILIATNEHVISGATDLSVAFIDDSAAKAELVGSDPTHDLAVIKVMKDDISDETKEEIGVIELGHSDDLVVGDSVIAIGNALGYGQSVSAGIVSALNRTITTQDTFNGESDVANGMIQTDASINPGNSGGALLNMKGELIGINSAKFANTMVEGMGYAIPIDLAAPILEDLEDGTLDEVEDEVVTNSDGSVKLGVTVATINDEIKDSYQIPVDGVYVLSVEDNSAAKNAGIKEGDIITAINDVDVTAVEELQSELKKLSEGDSATLTIIRMGESSFGENGYGTGNVTVTFGNTKKSA